MLKRTRRIIALIAFFVVEAALLIVPAFSRLPSESSEYTIAYTESHDGPKTIYRGLVTLHSTTAHPNPCMDHWIPTIEGELSGPAISSSPFQPALPFDIIYREEQGVVLRWCVAPSEAHVESVLAIPRAFEFHILRTSYDGTDLTRLLDQWGQDGTYDFNQDGTVDAIDLAFLLSRWNF